MNPVDVAISDAVPTPEPPSAIPVPVPIVPVDSVPPFASNRFAMSIRSPIVPPLTFTWIGAPTKSG